MPEMPLNCDFSNCIEMYFHLNDFNVFNEALDKIYRNKRKVRQSGAKKGLLEKFRQSVCSLHDAKTL